MYVSRLTRFVLGTVTALMFAFLYAPLFIIAVLSFNKSESFSWPPTGFTLEWWETAFHSQGARDALWTSLRIATVATLLALILGSLGAFALQRFAFFGREAVNLFIVLPIALPGIVTGIALSSAFLQVGIDLSIWTVVVAHATFCIVVVFNNVIARLRRLGPSVEEASADLGADSFQTLRFITFPMIRTALLAGGLLAFALSLDEIVVTTFTAGAGIQTLPQWIFNNMFRPNQVPVVNVVATFVILLSIIPVYLAQRMTEGTPLVTGGGQ
jgi:putative spermidine/putrescine transport system permease protein